MFRHGEPRANALVAAATAKSISALSPSAISVIILPVVGLVVGNVFLLNESTNSLLIKSWKYLNFHYYLIIHLHFSHELRTHKIMFLKYVTYFCELNFLISICHIVTIFSLYISSRITLLLANGKTLDEPSQNCLWNTIIFDVSASIYMK